MSPNLDNYKDWQEYLQVQIEKEIAKLTTIEVEEKWQEWKASQVDRQAAAQKEEIAAAVRSRNTSFFMSSAFSLGINVVFKGPFDGPHPVSVTGKKCTASGVR